MQKINKRTTLIIISITVALIIIAVSVWIFFQYKTLTSPGYDGPNYQGNSEKIQSVSGKGSVSSENTKKPSKPATNTNDKDSSATNNDNNNGGTSNTSRPGGRDPVYNSPSSNGGGSSYVHAIDTRCFDAAYEYLAAQSNQQMQAEMNQVNATATNNTIALLNEIDAAKPGIRQAALDQAGDDPNLKASAISRNNNRDRIARPAPTDDNAVFSYARAWTDNTHNFDQRAAQISQDKNDQSLAVTRKYDIPCN